MKQMSIKRLLQYQIQIKKALFHTEPHGKIHLQGSGNIKYVFPYVRAASWETDHGGERVREFWRFLDGDDSYYERFYRIYVRALRQLFWMVKLVGKTEFAVVPSSNPEKQNAIGDICSRIAREESFLLVDVLDGSDLLVRLYPVTPVHRGGGGTVESIRRSIHLSRPLRSRKVVLLDDIVRSGKTIQACRQVLREAGADKVYALCLYGVKVRK